MFIVNLNAVFRCFCIVTLEFYLFNHWFLFRRRGFLVVDFDEPSKPKKVIYSSKWEPGALEWSPHVSNEDLFAMIVRGSCCYNVIFF